jgi:hypothetical protein
MNGQLSRGDDDEPNTSALAKDRGESFSARAGFDPTDDRLQSAHARANTRSYRYAGSDGHARPDRYGNPGTNGYPGSYRYTHSDSNRDRDPDAHT